MATIVATRSLIKADPPGKKDLSFPPHELAKNKSIRSQSTDSTMSMSLAPASIASMSRSGDNRIRMSSSMTSLDMYDISEVYADSDHDGDCEAAHTIVIHTSPRTKHRDLFNSSAGTASTSGFDSNSNHTKDEKQILQPRTFTQIWKSTIDAINYPLKRGMQMLTHHAATNVYLYVIGTLVFSFAIVYIGFKTNFYVESSENELWKPTGSQVEKEGEWAMSWQADHHEWTFPAVADQEQNRRLLEHVQQRRREREVQQQGRLLQDDAAVADGDGIWYVTALIHNNGANVVTREGAEHLFVMHDVAVNTPGYPEFCSKYGQTKQCPDGLEFVCSNYDIPSGENAPMTCERFGPTGFWLHSLNNFQDRAVSDQEVQEAMSISVFPGENLQFSLKNIIGFPQINGNDVLEFGKSYTTVFVVDNGIGGYDLAKGMLDRLLELREDWATDPSSSYTLEIFSTLSFPLEFQRGIVKDIPLVPVAFVVMSLFTMLVFYKRDWVKSQSVLGFGAVACVLLSLMTSYGILFCIGVPFTALTQLLPFIMFGVGLDDAFILMTAYARTDSTKDPVERVRHTIDEVGMSIFMTSATSAIAFALGCTSSIPAVRWLCLYAFPAVIIDFVYQITFFIALMVIDDRRVQSRRRDWLCCFAGPANDEEKDAGEGQQPVDKENHFTEHVMMAYANFLMQPCVKFMVLVVFGGLFAFFAYSASQLEVAFDFTSVLPNDSYLKGFNDAMTEHAQLPSVSPAVYFRFVNQSDSTVLDQIEGYVNELVERVDGISSPPFRFWLRDYREFMDSNKEELFWKPFNETLHLFLDEHSEYRSDFALDAQGNVVVSRTQLDFDNIDLADVHTYLTAFRSQREVGSEQEVNAEGDWSFFTFDTVYYLWGFLDSTQSELRSSTICGIAAVSFVSLLVIPHWAGVVLLTPMIFVLYIDLMGFLQLWGVTINGISFIALVMSIGLLVDFIMHTTLCYYESTAKGRVEKTKEVLRTMGVSILLGGVSTLLGTLPLAFASNGIFNVIFKAFVGIVVIGVSHGLIVVPVILSMIGPE